MFLSRSDELEPLTLFVLQELERERQAHGVLQFQFKEMKETLRQTEELLTVSY